MSQSQGRGTFGLDQLRAIAIWLLNRRGQGAALVTTVSMYSYPIYLVNLLLREVLVQKVAQPEGWAVAGLMTAAWLLGTYGLSWLCYHGDESRITRLRDFDWRTTLRIVTPAAPMHHGDRLATVVRHHQSDAASPRAEPSSDAIA